MNLSETMELLKQPQHRMTLIKASLVSICVLALLLALGFWFYLVGFKGEVARAMSLAASTRPVIFTEADAATLRATREPGARPVKEVSQQTGADPGQRGQDEGRRKGESKGGGRGPLSEQLAALIEAHPLFGAPPRSGPPQANVQGILGEMALINGQWIKIGETQGGIKLLQTLPDKVIVEIEGQQREASVWSTLPTSPEPQSAPSLVAAMSGRSTRDRDRSSRRMDQSSGSVLNSLRDTMRRNRDSLGAYRGLSGQQGSSRNQLNPMSFMNQGGGMNDAANSLGGRRQGLSGQKIYQGPVNPPGGAQGGVLMLPSGNQGVPKRSREQRNLEGGGSQRIRRPEGGGSGHERSGSLGTNGSSGRRFQNFQGGSREERRGNRRSRNPYRE